LRIRSVEEPLIRDRCRAVMEELGIEGISAKNAYSLSAGRAHLVSIARGFVLDPEIIFLDEPFTYLRRPFREGEPLEGGGYGIT
jgi:energy-coupling factor transporter ATP-binding protein EcfA2